jgi:integrase
MPSLIRAKTGVYYVVTRYHGKQTWKSTGTKDKIEAYQKFLNGFLDREGKKLTECVHDFMPYAQTNFSKKTVEVYKFALSRLITIVGDICVGEITSFHIEKYKEERVKEVSRETVNMGLRALKAFFNTLIRWKFLVVNPSVGVRELRTEEKMPPYLTTEELVTLTDSIKDKWLRGIVIFASMTGMRLGEVLNLNWDDVDLPNRIVRVLSSVHYRTKSGKMRVIPLNQTALDLLNDKEDKTGFVFPGKRGGRANSNHVSAHFRKAASQAKMKQGIHFHSLRHTFASLLVKKGVSLYQVQKLLGHSSSRVTEIYAHLQNSEMHELVNRLDLPPNVGDRQDGQSIVYARPCEKNAI